MVTTLWVLFDLAVVYWTSFLDRKLTLREKGLIALLGIGVAVYGGYSEHQDDALMTSLQQGQEFTKGQLDMMGHLLGGQINLSTTNDLKGQLGSLKGTVSALKHYKDEHEAEEWPTLTGLQQEEWLAVLSKYPAVPMGLFVSDERSEQLVDALKTALKAARWPAPNVMPGPPVDCATVTASPPSLAYALGKLVDELGCHAVVYTGNALPKGQSELVQIMIGRRTHQRP